MSKPINEDLLKELVSRGTDYGKDIVTDSVMAPGGEKIIEEPEKPKKRRVAKDYTRFLVRRFDSKKRACVYINSSLKEKLERIASILPTDSLPLANYLDNILEHHLDTFSEDINELYRNRYNPEKII